ncbi:hypothetical protein QOZ98_000123 [Planomicrobium stackebrandtii]|uniref:Uncharacterized protein n=1 Tax=Planomicrobium stackebrandtii TaxID=253160 RepID=A0ABU0GQF3_9BACL|nr:hypothetical protein [Planomicrobium stackebrandtii]MDQ0427298.1 hypothetical protein [Planomicrobium stackebrandtii]
MERIETQFFVLFSDEQSPYFQVDPALRVAFPFHQLKGKTCFQRAFTEFLFGGDSQIDLTFLKSYATGTSKHFHSFEKQSLHQTIRIQNWREDVVLKQDDIVRLSYVTIQDLAVRDVLAYTKSIVRGKKSSFIAFYNARYLLTVDDDECVVISKTREDMNAVQNFIQETEEERSTWRKSILA